MGMGIKYNLRNNINFTFEISYRFTNTDYLDDVSTTYAGPACLPSQPNGQPSMPFCCRTGLMKQVPQSGKPAGREASAHS